MYKYLIALFFIISLQLNLYGYDKLFFNNSKFIDTNIDANSFYRLSNPSVEARYFTNEGFRAIKFGLHKIAKNLFYKACVKGDDLGCLSFNEISLSSADYINSSIYKCNIGDSDACFSMHKKHLNDEILDYFKINWYLSKSCKLGNLEACLLEALKIKPYIDDRQILGNACFYNNAEACYKLSTIYLFGKGIPKNIDFATKLIKKSCSMGFKKACINYMMLLSRR